MLKHLLHRARQAVDKAYALDPLTSRQVVILAHLGKNEGASQTHIVLATGIDRATLAMMVGEPPSGASCSDAARGRISGPTP